MKNSPDFSEVKLAIAQSTISGAIVGTGVDVRGFGRAKFVFTFGTPLADAKIGTSSIGIWAAAGSNSSVVGAQTYAVIPTAYLAAATSGVISNNVAVLDVAIPAGKAFLQVSGSFDSSDVPHSAIVELYSPVVAPPTHAAPVPVVIG